VANAGDGDNDSDIGSDNSAMVEAREEALSAFMPLASKENGHYVISLTVVPKLFDNLGTTYCEEDHGKKIRKLEREPGKIRYSDFESWYVGWLLGADSDDDPEEEVHPIFTSTLSGVEDSWGDIFNVDKESWSCGTCMVRNNGTAAQCAACEEPRPGYEKAVISGAASSGASGLSSIGVGGFVFGGGAGSTTSASTPASGFSFGTTAATFSEGSVPNDSSSSGTAPASIAGHSGTASFPPMFAKAPTAFGSAKASSATPFSATAAKSTPSTAAPPVSSSGIASFLPMSAKAPTAFGGSATSSATPFGAPSATSTPFSVAKPVATSGTASLPPTSAKAPKAFGGTARSPATPFGAPAAKSTPSIAAQPVSSSGTASFPPMSAKAPTSFGGSATSSATPFGASAAKSTPSIAAQPVSSSGTASFPPLSAKAPTAFGGSAASASTPFGAPAAQARTAEPTSSSNFSPLPAFGLSTSSGLSNPFGDSSRKGKLQRSEESRAYSTMESAVTTPVQENSSGKSLVVASQTTGTQVAISPPARSPPCRALR
jgi:hypothetical protein